MDGRLSSGSSPQRRYPERGWRPKSNIEYTYRPLSQFKRAGLSVLGQYSIGASIPLMQFLCAVRKRLFELLSASVAFAKRGWPLVLLGFGTLSALRLHSVRGASAYTGCPDCLTLPSVVSDLRPLGVLLVTMALAWFVRSSRFLVLLTLVAVSVPLVLLVDLAVYMSLGYRLLLSDFLRYGTETGAIWSVGRSLLFSIRGMLALSGFLLMTLGSVWTVWRARYNWRVGAGIGAAGVLAFNSIGGVVDPQYVDASAWRDVFSNNVPSGVDVEYSTSLKARLAKLPMEPRFCTSASGEAKSVILVIMESLSYYHSYLQSGLLDATPEMDRLARQHSYLSEFHANGFSTDGGMIALLTGNVPLPSVGRYKSVDVWSGFEKPRYGELQVLKKAGYGMEYFTSADLGFLAARQWLDGLGFEHIEGPEHPMYNSMKRGSFGDPGDQALYDRYLDWYDKEKASPHHFSVLQTISTHPPFVLPGQLHGDEFAAFRVADRAVAQFVSGLQQRGYFENGILMITGDHRSMTPHRAGEQAVAGRGAISRVPAIIVGNSGLPQGAVNGRWQQVDFLPSLLRMAGQPSCVSGFQGRFLGGQPQTAKYVLHAQGVVRDRVIVWPRSSSISSEVLLDGDVTRWVEPNRSDEALEVLAFINRERSARPEMPDNLARILIRWKSNP